MAGNSAAGRVAKDLRQRMLTGQLRPGTRLSQQRIATEYGVSRMPARDALLALARERLVDVSGAAAVVRPLSAAELQELCELREAVEPLLTWISVPNLRRGDLTRMAEVLQTMETGRPPAEWLELDNQFHSLIYSGADRPHIVDITEHLRRLTGRYLHLHLAVFEDMGQLHEDHRRIYSAVGRRNAAAAARLMRTHLATAHEMLREVFVR
jgi:DNA-binding GntR family transcriptional regulator